MDPSMFVEQSSAPGLPAPIWFVQFFKALGFALHAVPMNLWYAGLIIALWLHVRGDGPGKQFGRRLLQQMPIIVAFGVNLGIVPLLFLQLAYHRVFYPATILMAWSWLAIIPLVTLAYYGVYAYAWGIRNGAGDMAWWRRFAGWCAAILFVGVGFLFANGFTLSEHVDRWGDLWSVHSRAGAALGTALNVGDATLWPRWALMFGLALGTTAVWLLVDATWLARQTVDDGYREWAWAFAKKLYAVGLAWFAVAGTWYVFGTWSKELRTTMFAWPMLPLTVATALAPGLPWILMRISRKPGAVAAVAGCQFGVLGLNALSRQTVQNLNIKSVLDVWSQPTAVQWGPLAMFLIVFVVGVGIVGWMVFQAAKCGPKSAS